MLLGIGFPNVRNLTARPRHRSVVTDQVALRATQNKATSGVEIVTIGMLTNAKSRPSHRRKGVVMRSALKRLTEEDRFARKFCCWANNHKGWSKTKKRNRRIAKRKLNRETERTEEWE